MNKTLHSFNFGFDATKTAQNFVHELVRGLQAATQAGLVPAPAYAVAGQKYAATRN